MSYSTPSEKYRKYKDLLRDDPHNEVYSRKLMKYGNMVKKSQKGGNLLDQILPNTPQFDDVPATKEPVPNTDASGSNGSKAKTENLVRKINDMIAYAQENGMTGGTKKRSAHGSGSGSRVKGYRQMVGGAREVPAQIQAAMDKLKQSMGETEIIQGVSLLKEKAVKSTQEAIDLKARVDSLTAQLEAIQQEKQSADENIGTKEKSLGELEEAYKALRTAIELGNGLTKEQDVEKAKEILRLSKEEITKLKEEIARLKEQADKEKETIAQLTAELKKATDDLQELEGVHDATIKGYEEVVTEYDKKYKELMGKIGALTTE